MTVKKFFKALSAGVQLMIEFLWPFLRCIFFIGLPAVVGALITKWICNDLVSAFMNGIVGLVFGVIAWVIFNRCKEVVRYADENEVDMKTAWRDTKKMVDYDDDFFL